MRICNANNPFQTFATVLNALDKFNKVIAKKTPSKSLSPQLLAPLHTRLALTILGKLAS